MSNSDKIESPQSVTTKRKETPLEEVESICKKMMPSLFNECHPIANIEDIDGVLREPPRWVQRVIPLKPRPKTVIQNVMADCHSDSNHFLARSRLDSRIVPRTLVCHDYKGGYQADRYLHYSNEEIFGNGYPFYNWAQIDIFVYFSHHFITIPPLCWINAGHNHGVKVLGTLITEFNPGSEICDKKIFKNSYEMRKFAQSLAEITKIFGFDGWLLNIENKVENIGVLKDFVPYLTKLIHQDNPNNLVIWYDSVTEKGELSWQNELNSKNRYFFDSCDGIFLNYSWKEENLINSVEAAKHRNLDVFVGIDVFGRNMFGGGKFHTYKAAELATRFNLSMAIFAPGWTHETLEKTDNFFEQFLNRDCAFWSSLWPYFYTHPIGNYFTTNFSIGLDKSCYNIFNQQHQLSKFLHPKEVTVIPEHNTIQTLMHKCNCIQQATLGSKNACLLTTECLRKDIKYVHHLFACDLKISDNTVVYFLTKNAEENSLMLATLTITILTSGVNGSFRQIQLLGRRKDDLKNDAAILEVNQTEERDVFGSIRSRFSKMIDEERWNLNVFLFTTSVCNILEVGGTIENGTSIYLGGFGIESADGDFLKTF